MNEHEVSRLVADVKYKDWKLRVLPSSEQDVVRLDINRGMSRDSRDGKPWPNFTVNCPLHIDVEPVELRQSAFNNIMLAEVHEVAEFFRYRGEPVFNPHTPEGHSAILQALRFVRDYPPIIMMGGESKPHRRWSW